jgi:hypothetical protein
LLTSVLPIVILGECYGSFLALDYSYGLPLNKRPAEYSPGRFFTKYLVYNFEKK